MPKYVLTKYERIECEAVWKSKRARHAIDATLSHLLDGVDFSDHRRDAVAVTASARWRGGLRTHRFEDLLKAHTARLDALKACKAEIVKAPTPKAMTETPLEGDAMMILKAKMMAGK